MITENELRISNESYTHKDFYQIYPEILELVKKITDRYDPSSSNESDPGVVLLKLLAFIADKLNYNLDKNILECFMPSATQADSMRKLCEMMGYNMKYYNSAVADVSFMWVGTNLPNTPEADTYILIDRFTEIQDDLGEVNFVLTDPVTLTYKGETVTKKAIEGTLQKFEINDDDLVKLYNLDDNRRLYLPETQIAENGIWISNALEDEANETFWKKVDNLNTQQPMSKVYKFAYDNKKRLPYILFPEDISELIGNGLRVKYIRTSGANGNIAPKTLTRLAKLENVNLYQGGTVEEVPITEDENVYLNIQNSSSTMNGCDFETLDQAYDSFKKTVGTFDTLVTCRDYANKIYQLVWSDLNTNPLVSNVQCADIKDDINLSSKIVSFDEFGIFYSDISSKTLPVDKVASVGSITKGYTSLNKLFYTEGNYYEVIYIGSGTPDPSDPATDYDIIQVSEQSVNKINNFDIYIYPLKDINSFYTVDNYNNSFKPNYINTYEIISRLSDIKTLSHNIKQLGSKSEDIYNIKNYYHLNARISTTYKVTEYEASQILNNIYYALWHAFNARKLDYGEEIPFDTILSTIESADTRIKVVSLEEPEIKTVVMNAAGEERTLIDYEGVVSSDNSSTFYKLISKNVLAGKLPLFNYDERFDYVLGEVNAFSDRICGAVCNYAYTGTSTAPVLTPADASTYSVTALTSEVEIPLTRASSNTYTLKENEIVTLICPNLTTVKDGLYAAYVNYFFSSPTLRNAVTPTACKLTKIKSSSGQSYFDYYLIALDGAYVSGETNKDFRESLVFPAGEDEQTYLSEKISELGSNQKYVWYWNSDASVWVPCTSSEEYSASKNYTVTKQITSDNWMLLYNKFKTHTNPDEQGLFYIYNSNITNIPGKLVDENHNAYRLLQSFNSTFNNLTIYACLSATDKSNYTALSNINYGDRAGINDTVGVTPPAPFIPANTEYELRADDKLYINYTDSNDVVHNITYYKKGSSWYKRDDINEYNTGLEVEFSGIIKCNFDLYDSNVQAVSGYGKAYSKKDGYAFPQNDVPGMYSLDAQSQIEIRDFVFTRIAESPFYCYWSLLNAKNELVLSHVPGTTSPWIYEYVLNNDEYFFYTDSLKNSLVTFSSGTRIKIVSGTDRNNQIVLTLSDSTVELESIASEGIGAFSDTAWKSLKLNENQYIEFEENQIVTAGEGDSLTGVPSSLTTLYTQNSQAVINNNWALIADASAVKVSGNPLPKFNFDSASPHTSKMKWMIRSNLQINMNDKEGQLIQKDTDTNPVIQKIELYSSFYKSVPLTPLEQPIYEEFDPSEEQTEVCGVGSDYSTLLATFSSSSGTYLLKSNYPLSQPGGVLLSMHRFTVENKQKDDLYIYPYKNEDFEYVPSEEGSYSPMSSVPMYANSYYKLSFNGYDSYKLPVFIPENTMGVLMIYYAPSEGVTVYPTVKLVDSSTPAQTISNAIALYRNSYDGTNLQSSITLEKGINVIRIKQSGYIEIKKQVQTGTFVDTGTILTSEIDIVNIKDNPTGINYKLLNIPAASCESFVKTYIIDPDLDNIFYFNAPIDKYNELDVNIMDQYSWFNYNNVCNKFVISQLDSDFSDIQIAKSSRVSKW